MTQKEHLQVVKPRKQIIPDFQRQLVQPAPIEDKYLQVAQRGKGFSMQLAEIVLTNQSSCKWLSPANDLDQTLEGNSPSLLDIRLRTCKLLRPAKRWAHTSAGNLLSLLVPRLRSCNLPSPEKTSAGSSLSVFRPRSSSCNLPSPEKLQQVAH